MAIAVKCPGCGRQFRLKDAYRGRRGSCPACQREIVAEGKCVPDYDAFISHSHEDKALADALCATLEQTRVRCWIAPRDIGPGDTWASAIIGGIEKSQLMVLIYSSHSNTSAQVLREVERAVSKGVAILPFRIEDTPMSKDMEYFLSAAHWLDALTSPMEEHLERLAARVRVLLSGDVSAVTPPQSPAADVLGVMRNYPEDGFFIAPHIPKNKLRKACISCEVPAGERILAVLDCTVFGSAKNALVFGCQGLYYGNGWSGKQTGIWQMDYESFLASEARDDSFGEVDLGGGRLLEVSGASISKARLVPLLNELKEAIRSGEGTAVAKGLPVPNDAQEWDGN